MAKRDSFLLRIDPGILESIRAWSADEMRSMNGHIEYLLRDSLRRAGRLSKSVDTSPQLQRNGSETQTPDSECSPD